MPKNNIAKDFPEKCYSGRRNAIDYGRISLDAFQEIDRHKQAVDFNKIESNRKAAVLLSKLDSVGLSVSDIKSTAPTVDTKIKLSKLGIHFKQG
ncbi:MAG: hypothetical protein RLZ35_113 [Pseudomonadota bacterium]|jgi:hypothetical protein